MPQYEYEEICGRRPDQQDDTYVIEGTLQFYDYERECYVESSTRVTITVHSASRDEAIHTLGRAVACIEAGSCALNITRAIEPKS